MTYTITIESPHHLTETHERKRRDAGEYLFRRAVYAALRGRGLLDRPIARRVMARAEEASQPDCDFLAVYVQETTIRFCRAA